MKRWNSFSYLIFLEESILYIIPSLLTLALFNMFTFNANADSAEAYFLSSHKSLKASKLQKAIEDLNKLIEIYPNHPKINEAYNNRGLSKKKIGDYEGALLDYDKSIEINPDNSYAYYNRANLKRIHLGDFYGAIFDYNKVIEIDPNNSKAYKLIDIRGSLKIRIGDAKGGCTDYKRAALLGHAQRRKWLSSTSGSRCHAF